jgi:hypothetical protein
MARKRKAPTKATASRRGVGQEKPKLRGRPPLAPRTALAQWIQDRNMTVVQFSAMLSEEAPRAGLRPDQAPKTKTLLDAVNARHWPSLITVELTRRVTKGAVDVGSWVRDLAQRLS